MPAVLSRPPAQPVRLWSWLSAITLALAVPALPAAIERDLGQGLAYFRVEHAGEDLARLDASLARGPVVVDLRSLKGSESDTDALAGRLIRPPAAKAPQFILLAPTTPTSLVAAASIPHPGRVTLAAKSPAVTPDVAVQTSLDDDRAAFAALAAGSTIEQLTTETVPKERHDEASILQDRHSGATPKEDAAPTTSPDQPPALVEKTAAPAATPPAPAAPFDRVLQRAVHLHRALRALRQL